ncbi:hypothetical protein EBR96_10940, partial [bacterium]|nr:hypothetical protein [bacterium]
MDVDPASVDGLEAADVQLVREVEGHVPRERNPQGPILGTAWAEGGGTTASGNAAGHSVLALTVGEHSATQSLCLSL